MHRAGWPLALALGAAAACAPRDSDTGGTREARVSRLDVQVVTDKPAYRPGEPIVLSLTVLNPTGRPITLEFSSAQRYDFVIEQVGGGEVWRWGADQMFAQMIGEQTVPPTWQVDYSERYAGNLTPGTYRARGILTTMGEPREGATEFVVR